MLRLKDNYYVLIDGDGVEGFRETLSKIVESENKFNVVCVSIPHEHSYVERKAIAEELGCDVLEVSGALTFAALKEQLKYSNVGIGDEAFLRMVEDIKLDVFYAIADSNRPSSDSVKYWVPIWINDPKYIKMVFERRR